MYKIIIADDERTERLALKKRIEKSFDELEVCAAVTDGEELIEAVRKSEPDIIIVDIEMPVCSGIEAISRIRQQKLMPDGKILLYTAYEQFEYAKQALRMKVDDYILKPMDPVAFKERMYQLVEELDKERNQRKVSLENNRLIVDYQESAVREFMKSIPIPGSIYLKRELFNHIIDQSDCMKVIIRFKTASDNLLKSEDKMNEEIYSGLEELIINKGKGYLARINADEAYAYLCINEENMKDFQHMIILIEQGLNEIMLKTGRRVYAAIGSMTSCSEELYISYREAGKLLEQCTTASPCIYREKVVENKFYASQAEITEALVEREYERLTKIICKCLFYHRNTKRNMLIDMILDNVSVVTDELNERQLSDIQRPDILTLRKQLSSLDGVKGYQEWMIQFYREYAEKHLKTHSLIVKNILVYVSNHYQEDISLELLADVAGVSPSRLSRDFSQEMGTSISNYVNEYRIMQACKLIKNGHKYSAQKLSEQVGYTSASYFFKVFHKVTGMTLKEYKQRL